MEPISLQLMDPNCKPIHARTYTAPRSVEQQLQQLVSLSLSYDIYDKWNINNQCQTSCIRPGHIMVFLIVFSVLVCPR
jgi:hypothetical protein